MKRFHIERITDISNELCDFLDKNVCANTQLIDLYDYHKGNHHIYPLTNWHAHRIRCLSKIASKLGDKVKIWECHFWILEYFYEKSHCHCHCPPDHYGTNHDFFHRDSLQYLIYGSQALANASTYLQPITHYHYYEIFQPILDFLQPYLHNVKHHKEYIKSEIVSDKQKPSYGQDFQPSYASTFLRIIDKLKHYNNGS